MAKEKKLPKIQPYGPTWTNHACELARDYAPEIKPCKSCRYPVLHGYCCTFCGEVDP